MRSFKRILLLATTIGYTTIYSNHSIAATIQPEKKEPCNKKHVTIQINNTHQTIESFAASDCWLPNIIGNSWTEDSKEGMAELLFSGEIIAGQPQGIGLSGWRFNLGGGSANQGDTSGIKDISRRAESFMDPITGELDWSKQAGQKYFLKKAREYGMTSQYVMFCNTPPVHLTLNGLGYNKNNPLSPAHANISKENYEAFAEYIAQSLKHFKDKLNIEFDYISPANEPQYNWDEGNQEGTPYQNDELSALVHKVNKALEKYKLNTRIMITEAAKYSYLYMRTEDNERSNHIKEFFDATSPHYVGNLSKVAPLIAGHSYWMDGSWDELVSTRKALYEAATAKGLKIYQTEWSMLASGHSHYNPEEFVGFNRFTEMDVALYMAKVIHCDLTYAEVSSWSFWTSIDVNRWKHGNRFLLIKAIPTGKGSDGLIIGGDYKAAKTLWALGNYSLFVRPGYKRVDIDIANYSKQLFGDAFISEDGKKVVAVYSNLSESNCDITAAIEHASIASIKTYTTNTDSDLMEASIASTDDLIIIQPQSIVTVVYTLDEQ